MDDLERLEQFRRWRRHKGRDRAARRRVWAVHLVVLLSIGIATVRLTAWLKTNAPPPASSSAGARVAAIDQPAVTQAPALAGPSAVAAPPAVVTPPGTVAPSRATERPGATSAVPPAAMTSPALHSDRRAPQRVAPKTAVSIARQPPSSERGRQDPGAVPVDSPEAAPSPVDSVGPTPVDVPPPQVEPTGPTPVESPGPLTAMTAERGDAAEVAPASPAPRILTESPAPPAPDVSTAPPSAEVVADPGRPAAASSETADTSVTPPPRVSDRVVRWAKGEVQEFRDTVKREVGHFRSGLEKVRRGIDGLRSRLPRAD
jgi:hypothetical protein